MPRSSRHKSHNKHKHSSKDAKEYSDSEDRKDREEEKVAAVRVSRESGSSEKRKLDSDTGAGGLAEEYSAKRRKERLDGTGGSGGDRWNGVGGSGGGESLKIDLEKGEKGEKGLKSKVLVDSKSGSKSSRRQESEKKEVVVVVESEEVKRSGNSSKVESRSKDKEKEKEMSRGKEAHQYKDKEMRDKEHAVERSERSSKVQDVVRGERSADKGSGKGAVESEGSRKQCSHFDERTVKQEVGNSEWLVQEDSRNPELEKELEKRTRRKRDGSVEKGKYFEDVRDSNGRRLSTKDERHKDEKHKDEKHNEEKRKDEKNKDDRYKDKYREELDRDHRNRDDRVRDNRPSKDHTSDRSDTRHSRDENKAAVENRHKKSKVQNIDHDSSPHVLDNRATRYKDYRGKTRSSDDDDRSDLKQRNAKEQRYEGEKKAIGGKAEPLADRGRSQSRLPDADSTVSGGRRKRSPSSGAHPPKIQAFDHDSNHHLDDRAARYKDYRGKKRSPDEEDRSDLKQRHTKEHRYEVEKKMNSVKAESLSDRGRSQSRLADGDSMVSGARRKNSPSSSAQVPKDNFRQSSKQAEFKYKDSVPEDRVRGNVNSSRELTSFSGVHERPSESWPTDKRRSMGLSANSDNTHLAELSSERSPVLDAQVSPLQLKEKSNSSTSIDRRPRNRTPIRRSSDVDETRHRSYGSKDVRGYTANDERGSQEWPVEKPADEFSQAEGDTMSVSSSFNRKSHLPSSSSSVLPPPPPFRTGVDSPSVFNSFEEDSRGKPNNRYKRSDCNVGRGQGNAWKGVTSWSSPVANGFMPFPQGPPPGGFHPMMPQFHRPPLFGSRPSMEMNPTGIPYHISDADRYSGHGRSFGWRNRSDEAPHLHGWDGNNSAFGDEAHMHGKPERDQNRHMMNDRGWEGQNNGVSMDFPSASRKEDSQLRASVDEVWSGKPGQRSRNDRSRSVSRAESIEIKISDNIPPEEILAEVPEQVVIEKAPEPSKKLNDNGFCHVYLSKIDISADLTHPELYKQCMSVLSIEGNIPDEKFITNDISIKEMGKAGMKISNTSLSAPLFPKIKDSLLQRAMALYKKQGEEVKARFSVLSSTGSEPKIVLNHEEHVDPAITCQEEPVPFLIGENDDSVSTPTQENVEELVPAFTSENADGLASDSNSRRVEDSVPTSDQNAGEGLFPSFETEPAPNSCTEVAEPAPNSCMEVVEPVLNLDSKEQVEHIPSTGIVVNVEADANATYDLKNRDLDERHSLPLTNIVGKVEADANATSDLKNLELAEDHSLRHASQSIINSAMEEITLACNEENNCSNSSPEGKKALIDDTLCAFIGVTDGSEALTPMSIECKSVNLSRIHSPESTH